MARGVLYTIFRRPQFCCCFPVRVCVIIMSILGILLGGVLSLICWFQVSRGDELTSKQRGVFIGGAIVESLFLIISIVGLVGGIVRKLKFVTAYTIGLFVHFVINLIVAAYLLYVVLHATHEDAVSLCKNALKNPQSQDQCDTLFGTIRWVYAAIASLVLIVELYGAIVATRYVYTLRREKRRARKPMHTRGEPASKEGWRTLPGFMRYRDASGATVYDSYYFPPSNKGHSRGASAYSLADSDLEGSTQLPTYDPPSAGLPSPKDKVLDLEDGYKDDDHEDREHEDRDRDSVLDPPPGLSLKFPWESVVETVMARRDSSDSSSSSESEHTLS